jgi:hypothetical protein
MYCYKEWVRNLESTRGLSNWVYPYIFNKELESDKELESNRFKGWAHTMMFGIR